LSYRVSFYREVVNSYGKPSKASLYRTEIAAQGSMDEAIAVAIAAFKRDRGVPCWRTLADGYEVSYEARSLPQRISRRRASHQESPDSRREESANR
jgi:hypothetical protein